MNNDRKMTINRQVTTSTLFLKANSPQLLPSSVSVAQYVA